MPSYSARLAAAMVAIAAAACSPESDGGNGPAGEPEPAIVTNQAEATPSNAQADAPEPAPGKLPPADEPLRFVGRWAVEAALCPTTAWEFGPDLLQTPAGSECRFERTDIVPGGYDIRAICTAEGPPQADVLELRFAESARAMLFESDSIADAGLVYCGPLESSSPASSAGGPGTR